MVGAAPLEVGLAVEGLELDVARPVRDDPVPVTALREEPIDVTIGRATVRARAPVRARRSGISGWGLTEPPGMPEPLDSGTRPRAPWGRRVYRVNFRNEDNPDAVVPAGAERGEVEIVPLPVDRPGVAPHTDRRR